VPALTSSPVIECRDLKVSFQQRPVLQGVDLQVAAGEFVALLGLNGAGKTTLLRAMLGLVPVTQGSLLFQGASFTSPPPRVGMLFQGGGLVPQLTVLENTLCGHLGQLSPWRTLWGFPKKLQEQAAELLTELGLGEHLHQRTALLSGGQQQRVAIARALLGQRDILLADEPTAGLDVLAAQQVMQTLADLNRTQGLTIVVVLHDLALAETYANRAVFLAGGRITYDGPCQNLQARFSP
jgi:phosphonate transport system ATP-binding protein